MLRSLLTAAIVAASSATVASAATVFDQIYVESDGFRPGATSDIVVNNDIGTIVGGKTIGIGGRIVDQTDTWLFETTADFSVMLADLPIDSSEGFNAQGPGSGQTSAVFSLTNLDTSTTVGSMLLTSTVLPPGFVFKGGPGAYALSIASEGVDGLASLYDLKVQTVPVPAALPLLVAALGALGIARRRRAH